MEVVTKYNPEQEVFFVHENKICKGKVDMITIKAFVDHEVPKMFISYRVQYKWVKKSENTGFLASDETKERYLDFDEKNIYATKQDLLNEL